MYIYLISFIVLGFIFSKWSLNNVYSIPRKSSALQTIAFVICALLASKIIQEHFHSHDIEDIVATLVGLSLYALINLIVLSAASRRRKSQENYKESELYREEQAANRLDIFLLLIPLFSPLFYVMWFALTWTKPGG